MRICCANSPLARFARKFTPPLQNTAQCFQAKGERLLFAFSRLRRGGRTRAGLASAGVRTFCRRFTEMHDLHPTA